MLDQPLAAQREGIAPRHRPPLLPAATTATPDPSPAFASPSLAGGQGVAGSATSEGGKRRRNRAGSTVKQVKQDARSRTQTPPPSSGSSSRAAMVIASTTQPSSPQASLLIGADGTPLLPALPQQQRRPSQPQLIAQSPLPNSSLLPSLPTTAQPPASGSSTPTAWPPLALAPTAAAATTAPTEPYRPASAKPPASRIPSFPLVDAYVPDANSTDRRHPRTLVPKDLGFPTAAMHGKVRKEDLDDRLLMATCAVLHGFENRALCPKEVAEVMLERDWLKNAGTTPFAHVSTCIRSHIARASGASPPYQPLLTPFELVGALTAEEVRAVGLHAEQRPAVKRGTLWYLNPQVFGPGVGADDPFVRCRKEVGLQPSDRQGLYIRGLVPLQATMPALPPDLKMSSSIFHSNGADDHDGDEEGMGRGKRKRRASSAMMAAMSTTPATPSPLSVSVGPSTASPVPIPPSAATPRIAPLPATAAAPGTHQRRANSFAGPSSAPARSGIPRLKLRLTALEENDSSVDDSDGHTGEAAARRKKTKKKVRRAGSEGLSRAGSVETGHSEDDDLLLAQSLPSHPSAFSSISSSALLAQSLAAASSPSALPRSHSVSSLAAPLHAVSPDSLSLANNGSSFPFSRPTSSHGVSVNLSMSAPNIFSHHFNNAPSPPDIMDLDAPSPPTSSALHSLPATAVSPASDSPTDEDDFHEAMLRGDDLLDFEWGSDSYISTAGTSSIDAPLAPNFASSTPLMLQQAELGPAPPSLDQALTPASSVELDETLRKTIEDQVPQLDTPATTPRSPGKEDLPADLAAAVGEEVSDEVQAQKEKAEMERGPLGIISRVGMRTTLCGEMKVLNSDEDIEDVVIILDDEGEDVENSQADISLISLVHETPPSARRTPRQDSRLTAPPPSPLPLEFNAMGALTNAFAATDFDFVGHDEADRSPFIRSSSFSSHHDDGDSADDEGEFDDMITVKVEDGEEEHVRHSSASPSRASSAYSPAPQYDSRLLAGAGVRAGSTGSSSSDDSFDPMTFVSVPMLATGLPVPQPAPSPPETTDWSQNVDMLDDLETELAGVDLMAPEAIGLDELDLAWAGDSDEAGSPTPEQPNKPRLSLPRSGSAAFLTGSSNFGSPHRFNSPMPSPRRISSSKLPVLADFAKKGAASPVPPSLTRTSSGTTIFSGSTGGPTPRRTPKPVSTSSSAATDIESIGLLDPAVVATIVQRGIVAFSVIVTDSSTSDSIPLFRRLDTDFCNATTLLQAALPTPSERAAALSSLLARSSSSAFRISRSSEPGIVGTWVALSVARQLVASYPAQLKHLALFLEDDLAARFPEPIPTMHTGSQQAEQPSKDGILGTPAFEGAELIRGGSTVLDSADEADEVRSEQGSVESVEEGAEAAGDDAPPPPRRTGRARRPTAAVQAEMDSPSTTPRKMVKKKGTPGAAAK